jgi:putative intracellular protease/amidase
MMNYEIQEIKPDTGLKNLPVLTMNLQTMSLKLQSHPQRVENRLLIQSLQPENQTEYTKRLQNDKNATEKLENTKLLSDIYPGDYDTLFLPGGHGPMWDLSQDTVLIK